MKKADTVWVRNNGTEPFSSRYDSEDFTIAPGESIEMLVDCAVLCLGFGEDDKTRALRRLGWAFMGNELERAKLRLAAFSFHMKESEALAHKQQGANAPASKSRSAAPAGGEPSAAAPAAVEEVATSGERPLKPILGKLAESARPAAG